MNEDNTHYRKGLVMPTDNMCPQDATTVAFSTVWKPIRPQVTDSDLIGSVIDALVVDENM